LLGPLTLLQVRQTSNLGSYGVFKKAIFHFGMNSLQLGQSALLRGAPEK